MAAAAFVAVMMAGCNATVGEGQREQIVSGCMSSAQSSGMPEGQVRAFCDCSADKIIEQNLSMTEALDENKAQEVARACISTLMPGAVTK